MLKTIFMQIETKGDQESIAVALEDAANSISFYSGQVAEALLRDRVLELKDETGNHYGRLWLTDRAEMEEFVDGMVFDVLMASMRDDDQAPKM